MGIQHVLDVSTLDELFYSHCVLTYWWWCQGCVCVGGGGGVLCQGCVGGSAVPGLCVCGEGVLCQGCVCVCVGGFARAVCVCGGGAVLGLCVWGGGAVPGLWEKEDVRVLHLQ